MSEDKKKNIKDFMREVRTVFPEEWEWMQNAIPILARHNLSLFTSDVDEIQDVLLREMDGITDKEIEAYEKVAEVMESIKMVLIIKCIKDTQLIEKYPQVLADVFHKPIEHPRGFRDIPAVDPFLLLDISEIAAEVNGKKLEDLSPEEFFEAFFVLHDLYFEMKKKGEVK